VNVKELRGRGFDIQYTCISHTWGRWEKHSSPVHVMGVNEWMVPENTIFEVKDLPQILSKAPIPTRFIWFDLLCIPQDKSQKLYLVEVSRQAIMFQHASSCIAWLNTIHSWTHTEAPAHWLCLNYLHRRSQNSFYNTDELLSRTAEQANNNIELVVDSGNFIPWLSSLRTLQEACLYPDMILCNSDWQPVSIPQSTTLSLNHLLTLYSLNREAYF
jgi:hypothetical protein